MIRLRLALCVLLLASAACGTSKPASRAGARTGSRPESRDTTAGDREGRRAAGRLLVAGEQVPVPFRVVGPRDPGGFDASLERCFFTPDRVLPKAGAGDTAAARRYGVRGTAGMPAVARPRAGSAVGDSTAPDWTGPLLRDRIDQVVLHYDAAVTSRRCFEVLHDERGLSCHFLVDVDGTIYQTLDLVHRARHATVTNDRSIGIEIAHVGAYPTEASFARLYRRGPAGLDLVIPASLHPPPGGPFRVASPEFLRGVVHGKTYVQADFTVAQHDALARLLPALSKAFPRVRLALPTDRAGRLRTDALAADELASWRGLLGHYHVTPSKVDPGPALASLAASILGRTVPPAPPRGARAGYDFLAPDLATTSFSTDDSSGNCFVASFE